MILPKVFAKIINQFASHKVGRWSVAYCYHDRFSKSLWRYKEIKNPKGRFLADPFVIENNGENFIFVEDLFFKCDHHYNGLANNIISKIIFEEISNK